MKHYEILGHDVVHANGRAVLVFYMTRGQIEIPSVISTGDLCRMCLEEGVVFYTRRPDGVTVRVTGQLDESIFYGTDAYEVPAQPMVDFDHERVTAALLDRLRRVAPTLAPAAPPEPDRGNDEEFMDMPDQVQPETRRAPQPFVRDGALERIRAEYANLAGQHTARDILKLADPLQEASRFTRSVEESSRFTRAVDEHSRWYRQASAADRLINEMDRQLASASDPHPFETAASRLLKQLDKQHETLYPLAKANGVMALSERIRRSAEGPRIGRHF